MLDVSQDRVHATDRAHHAQRLRDFQTNNPTQPPDLHAAVQGPTGGGLPAAWLKEHQLSGRHQLLEPDHRVIPHIPPQPPAFIPLTLPMATPSPGEQEVKIELRQGTLSVALTWPLSAAAELASWTAAILK